MPLYKIHPFPLLVNCPKFLLKNYILPIEQGTGTRIFGLKGGRSSAKTQTAVRHKMTKVLQNPKYRVVMGRTNRQQKRHYQTNLN